MALRNGRIRSSVLVAALVLELCCLAHSALCASQVQDSHSHHMCDHGHDHAHHHHHHEHPHQEPFLSKLPEELAEEEDMKLYGFGFQHDHDHDYDHDHGHGHFGAPDLSGLGNLPAVLFMVQFLMLLIDCFARN